MTRSRATGRSGTNESVSPVIAVVGRRAYVCDVVGNLTFGARCEQYVENEEWAPAENEREKHESQDLHDTCD